MDIPAEVKERFLRDTLKAVRAFYESEENRAAFERWKKTPPDNPLSSEVNQPNQLSL